MNRSLFFARSSRLFGLDGLDSLDRLDRLDRLDSLDRDVLLRNVLLIDRFDLWRGFN